MWGGHSPQIGGRRRRIQYPRDRATVAIKNAEQNKVIENLPLAVPQFIAPMLAKLAPEVPTGREWLYEVKFDGFRALAIKDTNGVHLLSRNENDLGPKFPELIESLSGIQARTFVIDGEIVAVDASEVPAFGLLQKPSSKPAILFYAFDLLNLSNHATTGLKLTERKALLQSVVKDSEAKFSDALDAAPDMLTTQVRKFGLEGIVAKQKNSFYESDKRSGAWLKWRANQEQEFIIGGYVPGYGTLESLLVGYYEADKLLFAGKVRAGYAGRARRDVYTRMKKLISNQCLFSNLPERKRSRWGEGLTAEEMKKCIWLKPVLVAQIAFLEWTSNDHLRHSKFVALRDDKEARSVVRENGH